MAFITHCWKNFLRLELLFLGCLKRGRLLCLVLSLMLASVAQADTPVELQAFKLERQESALYMSGAWQFDLPSALEDALHKGITL